MGSGPAKPRRHFVIPDCQVRPGVHLDHLDWIGDAIVEYRPDVVVCIGDWFDFPSLNGHEQPGSYFLENQRYKNDVDVGNKAFARMCAPMEREERKGKWKPRKLVTLGNHEDRADRVAMNTPHLMNVVGSEDCDFRDWTVYPYLQTIEVDGFFYSHFFQSSHSSRAIGGAIPNKLGKIGASFVHGHVQGLDMGTKIMGNGKTLWGFQAGSCYTQIENYRGAQGQRHWRGVLVLNEVENGECCPMPLSLNYLCRKNTGLPLFDYMVKKYKGQNWEHLK